MRLAGRALARNTCSRRFVPTRLALLLTLGRLTDSHRTRQSSPPVVIRRFAATEDFSKLSIRVGRRADFVLPRDCHGCQRRRRSIERPSLAGFLYVLPARLYNGFALPDVRERLC